MVPGDYPHAFGMLPNVPALTPCRWLPPETRCRCVDYASEWTVLTPYNYTNRWDNCIPEALQTYNYTKLRMACTIQLPYTKALANYPCTHMHRHIRKCSALLVALITGGLLKLTTSRSFRIFTHIHLGSGCFDLDHCTTVVHQTYTFMHRQVKQWLTVQGHSCTVHPVLYPVWMSDYRISLYKPSQSAAAFPGSSITELSPTKFKDIVSKTDQLRDL